MICRSTCVNRAPLVREVRSGVEVDVIVSPNASRSEVEGFDPWRGRLVIRLRAPPEKGEANEELRSLLSSLLGAKVEVLKGHTNRMKTVLVEGEPKAILKSLEAFVARP